eukprot:scaffold5120_cov33-Attheya_sp.AAC.1
MKFSALVFLIPFVAVAHARDDSSGERRNRNLSAKTGKGKDPYSTCWAESEDKAEKATDVYKHLFPMAAGIEDACVNNKFSAKNCRGALNAYTVAIL